MSWPSDMPIVLLHPFPLDGRFWEPLRDELGQARCLVPEFPGFGVAPAGDGVTISGFADVVADVIDAAGGRAVVCGLSLGGYVALALVARHPAAVAGLLLANTRADPDDDSARAARDRAIDTIRIDGFDVWRNGFVPRLLRPDPDTVALERVWTLAAAQDPDAVVAALEALRDRPDRVRDLARITVPTTVVAGAEDQVTPRTATDELAAAITGADLETIDEAGHLTALEQPGAFAGALRGLANRVG